MALRHGNKTYLQILLDPNRAKLLMGQAQAENIRATAWVRNLIYKELEKQLPSSVYKEAVAQDEASWRKSIRKRIEGRIPNNSPTEQNNDDDSIHDPEIQGQ